MIIPITEKTLREIGFNNKCNLYMRDGFSIELIKGHTVVGLNINYFQINL